MSMNEQMEESEASILHTYNRFPVVFEKGEGCYLYDSEGKEYLDFAAGIAVNAEIPDRQADAYFQPVLQ